MTGKRGAVVLWQLCGAWGRLLTWQLDQETDLNQPEAEVDTVFVAKVLRPHDLGTKHLTHERVGTIPTKAVNAG